MGQFLKQTFASIIGTIAALLILVTAGASGLVFLLINTVSSSQEAQIKDQSILVFDLSTQIRDSQTPRSIQQVLAGQTQNTIPLRQVLDSIDAAAKDDRIVGLFIDGSKGEAGSGYATMAEVRQALDKFRATGKTIIAYDVNWSEREYYLASVADRILLNPMGMIEFNGISSRQMFLKGALEKYGIGVQVVRVGDYKSAVEPYTRQSLSPENRQQTQALLTDVWQRFLSTVGESRQLSSQNLQQIADEKGFIEPQEAENIGLVDEIAYFDQVTAQLRELTGESDEEESSVRQIDLKTYITESSALNQNKNSRNKIAVVYAEGSIVGGKGNLEQIGSDRFAQQFRQLREDDTVKGIVLRVNSPGGSATASEIILREILLTKKEKPVVVSMGNVAASGGYWISAGADQIFAEENTITGSIGVFGLLPNFQEIGNNNGITWDVVKTGKLSDIDSPYRPKNDQELAIYQKSVAQVYRLFLNKVAEYRNLPQKRVQEIAQGRVWLGKKAVKIGLVDQIGGLESAIAYVVEQTELETDWQIKEYPEQRNWEDEIIERFVAEEAVQPNDLVTLELLKLKEELAVFQTFNDPLAIYARMPYNFVID
ncbi:MAG: signal peptide peptidase SppA [Xenococcaceae cyanobacterium MO_207.B15]|nr:signal peptide peptidase SppA [Xenococcaceae cyanobacterium MO_207.B15]